MARCRHWPAWSGSWTLVLTAAHLPACSLVLKCWSWPWMAWQTPPVPARMQSLFTTPAVPSQHLHCGVHAALSGHATWIIKVSSLQEPWLTVLKSKWE